MSYGCPHSHRYFPTALGVDDFMARVEVRASEVLTYEDEHMNLNSLVYELCRLCWLATASLVITRLVSCKAVVGYATKLLLSRVKLQRNIRLYCHFPAVAFRC